MTTATGGTEVAVEWPARCPFPGCLEELFSPADARAHIPAHDAEIVALAARVAAEAKARETAAASDGGGVPRGILVHERIESTFVVDLATMAAFRHEDAAERMVKDRLVHGLREYALGYGFDVHPESVWFERRDDPTTWPRIRFTAMWAPDPGQGCELRGGPADGEIIALQRADGGPAPMRHLLRQVMPPFPVAGGPDTPLVPERHLYQRAGIDSMRDCWVYEYVGVR